MYRSTPSNDSARTSNPIHVWCHQHCHTSLLSSSWIHFYKRVSSYYRHLLLVFAASSLITVPVVAAVLFLMGFVSGTLMINLTLVFLFIAASVHVSSLLKGVTSQHILYYLLYVLFCLIRLDIQIPFTDYDCLTYSLLYKLKKI